jgi:hypothetical protein
VDVVGVDIVDVVGVDDDDDDELAHAATPISAVTITAMTANNGITRIRLLAVVTTRTPISLYGKEIIG